MDIKVEKQQLDDFVTLGRCENCGDIVPEETLIDTDELIANGGYGSVCENCNWR